MIFCNNQILNVITNKWNKAMEIIKIINTIDSPKIPKKISNFEFEKLN